MDNLIFKSFFISAWLIIDGTSAFGLDLEKVVRLNNDGVAALNKGSLNLSISKLSECVELDPTYGLGVENLATAHNQRGLYRSKLKQYEDAFLDFDKAVKLSNNSASRFNRCVTALRIGNFELAYQESLRLNLEWQKGFAEIGLGHVEEGIRILKNADPPNLFSNIGLCIAYERLGKQAVSNSYKAKIKCSVHRADLVEWQKVLLPNKAKKPVR
ncbi:MAG TPA: hypothetical protein EYN91_18060 [Candidatus Melainabacteria bacterium]|jgi:tetratricopeptide (TPR) repeat protein|nr:hypothetical protein [Candidatus Melainabacteria bacterium]HIN65228.1 hypothetical protein [Candidatus Obscuribacterales bacterium]